MTSRIAHRFSLFLCLSACLALGVGASAQKNDAANDAGEADIKAPATEGKAPNPKNATRAKRATPPNDDHPVVRYTGELMRDSKTALSGVFPITFELYENEDDSTPFWQEQHFVAIDLGTYTIDLGAKEKLPKDVIQQRRWLAVHVEGLGELLREQITLTPHKDTRRETPTKIKNLSFAELADRAVTADLAHVASDAQRLGGKTLEEIDRFGELQRQFVQLRARVNNIQNIGGTTVAERTSMTEEVGTGPGEHFQLKCPKGQVVVGVTGRANDAIRHAKLICAPLEETR